MKIGVFDSGIGGMAIVNAIHKSLPDIEIVYKQDKKNVPYGNKSVRQLQALIKPFIEEFIRENCEIIVIACNTVTTTLAPWIREQVEVPVIGIEPMIKPAAARTKTNTIAVCATPATLASKRYAWLKETFAKDVTVLEPDCSGWSKMIEDNRINNQEIAKQMQNVCEAGADIIVLGCTHYHWIETEINELASKHSAEVMQPETAIVAQLKRVIAQLA